jgi:hypothetical protein
MIEHFIVTAIIAGALFLVGRSLFKSLSGREKGCGCSGNCANCTCQDFPEGVKIGEGK